MRTRYLRIRNDKRRRGTIIVLVAVTLTLLISIAALSVDCGYLYQNRRKLQTSADAAAEAGAIELFTKYELNRGADRDGEARASALSNAMAHGFGGPKPDSTVTINIPPLSGSFAGEAGYVEAIIRAKMPPAFSSIFGRTELIVTARSVAGGTMIPSKAGLLILDPRRKDSLRLKSKSSSLEVGGDIIVNSTDKRAVTVGKKSQVKADHVLVTGGIDRKSKQFIEAEVRTGVPPTPDPWATLAPPSKGTGRDSNDYKSTIGSQTRYDLQPGTYNSLKFDKNEIITMAPGTYYIDGGGFELKGSTTLMANGVTIFNTGKKGIKLNTSGNVTISPPTSGPYSGISLFQDRTNKAKVEFRRTDLKISGIVYAPTAQVKFNETDGEFDSASNDEDDDQEADDYLMEEETSPAITGSINAAIVARKLSIGKRSTIRILGTDINSYRPLLGVVE